MSDQPDEKPVTRSEKFLKAVGKLPFFRDIVKANAPAIPMTKSGKAVGPANLTEVMPPFGPGINSAPQSNVNQHDLASRVLYNDPRDLWYLSLPNKLTPAQVLQIMRSALGGDLWQQWQLQKLMSDSWVMFRKCAHELRSTIAGVRFTVQPYAEPGKQPSSMAKKKAACVARGLKAWRPDPFTDEKGMPGMIYHLLDSVLSGVSLVELQWQVINGEILPRAATWVHPRQFTFSNGGRIAIWDMNMKAMVNPDPDKFIVMQYLSDSGSALGCGLVRPLGQYFSFLVFNREWLAKFGEKHGSGFLKAFYGNGATEEDMKKLKGFVENAQANKWILLNKDLQEDAEYTSPANLGPDNPHRAVMDMCDEAATMLLLGQTATTHGNKGSSGINNNNNQVQKGVLTSRKEELAGNVAEAPLTQVARAICRVNFDGDDTECPIILADMTEPLTAQEKGMVITALSTTKTPMMLDDYYELTGTQAPTEGAQVINPSTGEIGLMGTMTEEYDATQAMKAPPDGFDMDGNPLPPDPAKNQNQPPQSGGTIQASEAEVRRILKKASPGELAEIALLIGKAIDEPRRNGASSALETKLSKLGVNRK